MQAPACSGSTFYEYKGTHSIVLMSMCDTHYCFTLVDIGNTGRHSDLGVFSNSICFWTGHTSGRVVTTTFREYLSPIPYFFVGDAAFPLKTSMLRPYPGRYLHVPESKRILTIVIIHLV